ncbi:MAG TPA: signal recognition particle-docking protein FtsY [Usitatibacteraceae bacterium]|nr:signal recognition particle-docking protein FtsY [Usitatibacteraceae bacterium]
MFETRSAPEGGAEGKPAGGWLSRLRNGLAKTRAVLNTDIGSLISRHSAIDEALFEELETTLIQADAGVKGAHWLIDRLRVAAREGRLSGVEALRPALVEAIAGLTAPLEQPIDLSQHRPFVIMISGVNGAGKTTTIGKLAKYFQGQGLGVLLAAGDTFRAAAREQLAEWGTRNNVTVIAQQGGDAAAIIFDAIQAARARSIDVVIADTAGRLPTQLHLMEEIRKIKRVIAKADPTAPHEALLVLDANTGQNALQQVAAFDEALGLTGLVITKLDGTARGGMIAALAAERAARAQPPLPVRFIGVGEGIDDLRPFRAREYAEALLRQTDD